MSYRELLRQSVKKTDSPEIRRFLDVFKVAYNDAGDYMSKYQARKLYSAMSRADKKKAAYIVTEAISGAEAADLVLYFDCTLEF
ncbi:MAG: hypothetical protein M0P69_04500 [Bacteroidales bacterium]|nr:hypothetical protein [Bacteroidales bacterium]